MTAWTRLWDGSTRRWRYGAQPERNQPVIARPRSRRSWFRRQGSNRILFINQYYWPDHASTAQHLTDLTESLARSGHEVHVICGRGSYKPGQPVHPAREEHNGVHIHRVGATSLGRRSTLTRMTDYLTFYASAALHAICLRRFDAAVTLTTPPLIGLVGTILKQFKGSRHVSWSMDLHPDASLALGRMSRSSRVVRFLSHLSDTVYRRADRVVVLGPYMADRIMAKGVRPGRIETIPVWSRSEEIFPLPRAGHPLREQLGLADKFVLMYSGNLGLAHSFEEILEAARRLRDRDEIVFLFVGDGPRMSEVRSAKEAEGLDNVRLLDYFPREHLHQSLSTADAHLISMRQEMTGIVVPGKLYGAMASGRPTVFIGPDHCESADTIREAGCGPVVRLGDADGLVSVIEMLAGDEKARADMGRKARRAFLERFERETCCKQWVELMADLTGLPALSTEANQRPIAAETPPSGQRDPMPAGPAVLPYY